MDQKEVSNLNQDQVNQSSKRTSNTTTMPDSQEVKSGATHSQIAQDNKKEVMLLGKLLKIGILLEKILLLFKQKAL